MRERAVFLENPGDLLYNIRDNPDRLEGTFMKKKIATVALAAIILLAALFSQSVFCASEGCPSYDDALSVAQGIIKWKKQSTGISPEEALFSADYSGLAGSFAGDWYAFGIGRLGIDDDYEMYLAALRENVSERYAKDGGLDKIKATEWHRITLAVLALGGDPTSFGRDSEGKPINLIADGVYNRDNLGAQGINGLIWGLIALDAADFSVPDGAYYTRDGDSCHSGDISRRGIGLSLRCAFRRAFEYYLRAGPVDSFSDVFLGTDRLFGGNNVAAAKKKQARACNLRSILRNIVFSAYGRLLGSVGGRDVFTFKIRSVYSCGFAGDGGICGFKRHIFACTVCLDGRKAGEDNEKIRDMMLTRCAQ